MAVHRDEMFPQQQAKLSLSQRPATKVEEDQPILSQLKRQAQAKGLSLSSQAPSQSTKAALTKISLSSSHSSVDSQGLQRTPVIQASRDSSYQPFKAINGSGVATSLLFSLDEKTIQDTLTILIPRFRSRELIFGIAHDTDIKNLAIFMGSLRDVSKDVEVIVFMNKDPLQDQERGQQAPGSKIPTPDMLAATYRIHILYYDIR